MKIEVQPDDRILLLALADLEFLRSLATRAPRGLVVGLGEDGEVRSARRALADLDNVMFVPVPGDGSIPWREEFFSRVIAPSHREAEPEMLRVLVPGGRVHLTEGEVVK
jgi:hypothetical protein